MRSLGIFLGVGRNAGGMFQYAQAILAGAVDLVYDGWRVEVVYHDPAWDPDLARTPFHSHRIRSGRRARLVSRGLLAIQAGPKLSSVLGRLFSPSIRKIRELNCDLWLFPSQDVESFQADVPSLVSVHDLMHRYEPHFPEVSLGRRFALREHRFGGISKYASGILVDSKLGGRQMAEAYGTDSAKIFPLPYVALSFIHKDEPPDFDKLFPLPRNFLFYPAQFWEHKNHIRLLEAVASIRDQRDIVCVFAGGKRQKYDEVRSAAARLNVKVIFPGYVPDAYLSGFYRRARALVMPTFFGPTNIPPLEAFACDCVAALSNNYGMPEQAGDAAVFFDPLSVEEMAAVIRRLWDDDVLCETLRARGRLRNGLWNEASFGQELRRVIRTVAYDHPEIGQQQALRKENEDGPTQN